MEVSCCRRNYTKYARKRQHVLTGCVRFRITFSLELFMIIKVNSIDNDAVPRYENIIIQQLAVATIQTFPLKWSLYVVLKSFYNNKNVSRWIYWVGEGQTFKLEIVRHYAYIRQDKKRILLCVLNLLNQWDLQGCKGWWKLRDSYEELW